MDNEPSGRVRMEDRRHRRGILYDLRTACRDRGMLTIYYGIATKPSECFTTWPKHVLREHEEEIRSSVVESLDRFIGMTNYIERPEKS